MPRPRKNYPPEIIDEARRLRSEGKSYREVCEQTGIARSTASLWLREVPLTADQEALLRQRTVDNSTVRGRANAELRVRRQLSTMATARDEIAMLTEQQLFLIGVALYWAEGAKPKPWRSSDRVSLINSDPDVIRLFLAWLDLLKIPRSELVFRLAIHETPDIEAARDWWSEVVGQPLAGMPCSLKRHNPSPRRRNVQQTYHGCLVVTVRRSSALNDRISGWWQGIVATLGYEPINPLLARLVPT